MQKKNKRVKDAPKAGFAQAAIRLATAVIKFRNKERNVKVNVKKCKTCNLGYIIVSML